MTKLLLYCCKEKNKNDRLVYDEHYGKPFYLYGAITENFESLNGKIVAECDFEVEEIGLHKIDIGVGYDYIYETDTISCGLVESKSCLSNQDLQNYLGTNKDNGEKVGYAIHIKNLHIFDKPREIYSYLGAITNDVYYRLKNAPQNMKYAYERKDGKLINCPKQMPFTSEDKNKYFETLNNTNDCDVNKYILISIQPQWLCKILNGEKTIEVRKKVLKEMLK